MKAQVCSPIRIASIGLVAATLMLAPARPAHSHGNSTVIPSSSGAAASAHSGDEADKAAETGNAPAQSEHHKAVHSQPKKKKTSFMHKMRDKAMEKVQKLFGKKQESKPEAKEVPQKDIE
jgi:hypothetical protein